MMNSETATFIGDLFARCPLGEKFAFLILTAIHPDDDRPTPSRHVPLGDSVRLEHAVGQLLLANQQGWGRI